MLFEDRIVKTWQILGVFLIIICLVIGIFNAVSGVNNMRHAFNVCVKQLELAEQRPVYCPDTPTRCISGEYVTDLNEVLAGNYGNTNSVKIIYQ